MRLHIARQCANVILRIPSPLAGAFPREPIHPNRNAQLKPNFNGMDFGTLVLKVVRNCKVALGRKRGRVGAD